jgi:hypothetical protein
MDSIQTPKSSSPSPSFHSLRKKRRGGGRRDGEDTLPLSPSSPSRHNRSLPSPSASLDKYQLKNMVRDVLVELTVDQGGEQEEEEQGGKKKKMAGSFFFPSRIQVETLLLELKTNLEQQQREQVYTLSSTMEQRTSSLNRALETGLLELKKLCLASIQSAQDSFLNDTVSPLLHQTLTQGYLSKEEFGRREEALLERVRESQEEVRREQADW